MAMTNNSWLIHDLTRFRHFLDSGDQALTMIVLYNDIQPRAGGTYISPDGLQHVCKWCISTAVCLIYADDAVVFDADVATAPYDASMINLWNGRRF